MDNDLRNKQDPQAAERLALEWNEMECSFQNDKFWYFISDNNEGMQIDNQSIICRRSFNNPLRVKGLTFNWFNLSCRKWLNVNFLAFFLYSGLSQPPSSPHIVVAFICKDSEFS